MTHDLLARWSHNFGHVREKPVRENLWRVLCVCMLFMPMEVVGVDRSTTIRS